MLKYFISIMILVPFFAACTHQPRSQDTTFHGRPAIRLANDTVEVMVVPSLGAVTHYSLLGQRNVLWINPEALAATPAPGQWLNYGGDKAWLWPQDNWEKVTSKGWPPPTDDLPYTATFRGSTLVLTSGPVPHYPVRIIREITVPPTGSAVTLAFRLEPTTPNAPLPDLAVWSNTPVPAVKVLAATLIENPPEPLFTRLGNDLGFPDPDRWGNTLVITRQGDAPRKSGYEAHTLVASYPDVTFILHASTPPGPFAPASRAQVYGDPDSSGVRPPYTPAYMELEFIAPFITPRATTYPALTVTWTLIPTSSITDK